MNFISFHYRSLKAIMCIIKSILSFFLNINFPFNYRWFFFFFLLFLCFAILANNVTKYWYWNVRIVQDYLKQSSILYIKEVWRNRLITNYKFFISSNPILFVSKFFIVKFSKQCLHSRVKYLGKRLINESRVNSYRSSISVKAERFN